MSTAPTPVDISRPLLRYRIASNTVGVLLVAACLSLIPKHRGGPDLWFLWVLHGWCYVVYLVLAFDLYRRVRWPLLRLLEMLVAGLLPGLTFVIERDISGYARTHPPALQASAT